MRCVLWRFERSDRKATILSDIAACARERGCRESVCVRVGVCEGGSGLLEEVEVVRSGSWRVELESSFVKNPK